MERIVKKPVKLDLHIHSCYSQKKDGEKVIHNTIENLPILYEKLANEFLNMIAITDHNEFNYELYCKINNDIKDESIYTGDLVNCLPGIEFDLELRGEKIHVISIFDDKDQKKLEKISTILKNNSFDNDKKNAYTEIKLKEILKKIDLSVALIAHQKSDVRAKMHNDNLSKLGQEEFDNLISVDYFDAVEFRSGKVEGMLANYKFEHALENMRYITGTDCHDWSVYPKQDKTCTQDITFTYMRSLCTFKGLVMALTEPSRIQIGHYGVRHPYIPSLPVSIDGKENHIPLSSGVNVIIGDNSIGKSLIVEKYFNKKYSTNDKEIIKGHKEYLTRKLISLDEIKDLNEFSILYRGQGGIRADFQKNTNLKDIDFFKNKFNEVDNSDTKRNISSYISKVWSLIKQNQERDGSLKKLNYKLNIPAESEDQHYYLKIISNLKVDGTNYTPLVDSFNSIFREIKSINENKLFNHTKEMGVINEQLRTLYDKYQNLERNVMLKNGIVNLLNDFSQAFNSKYQLQQAQQEIQLQTFRTNVISSHDRIIEALVIHSKPKIEPLVGFSDIKLDKHTNAYGDYKFTSRNAIELIDEKEIIKILLYPFKNMNKIEQLNTLMEDNIAEKFKKTEADKFTQQKLTNENLYEAIIGRYCEENIYKHVFLINKNDTDLITGNSPGKNALIFLDVLSHDQTHQIVVIDQPGDDVSQNRVASELVEIIRKMVINDKQVILVTHKAELVVNLDADNVIIIKESAEGKINIEYGALEYEGEGFDGSFVNVLSDVANILDGGVETIRKRWKRYDKKIN